MNNRIKILNPNISDKAVDHRGAIYSYLPHNSIVEFVYIDTKQGVTRGDHYHKEFDEYIMLVSGEGLYIEVLESQQRHHIVIGPGQCIYIPAFTPHTFVPLTDCKSVSFLTKRWNECKEPITQTV